MRPYKNSLAFPCLFSFPLSDRLVYVDLHANINADTKIYSLVDESSSSFRNITLRPANILFFPVDST